ncbi:putative polysaccharide biosynthesis protein [Paenibacillus caui]|uniref:putative polysaccharide biosynthesis protein n=1 Tax=Paenibacillus caui TaxID=2873927 RepID=UPI001CA97567|nr:oligosaccharide flippase family protein [Paenibacillus caui]
MKESTAASRLLKGAFLLGLAAILSKLLGTLQKIPLQNIGGDGVFGIYNTVYPFYTLLVTLATAGFSTAVSKFVAEREADGDERGGRYVLRISAVIMVALGLLGSLLLFFGAPLLGSWIGSTHTIPALRAAAPALLFVPASAALRGYFQGLQNMFPTALSQVIEQAVRVAVMIVLLLYLTSIGAQESGIAGGAMFGSAAGGAAGLAVMLFVWRRHRHRSRTGVQESASGVKEIKEGSSFGTGANPAMGRALLKSLLAYALPICLAALAIPLLGLVDTFTLPRLLADGSRTGTEVMAQIGIYNRGLPLVQLVTMMAASLSVLFIPSMAELKYKGDWPRAANQAGLALRWFWLIGCAASVGLAVLAEPINMMLYKNSEGSDTFAWLAMSAAPATIATISAALLQGLGSVRAPALAMTLAAVLKAALNVLLAPAFGIDGAAAAGIAAYALAAALNMALLVRRLGLAPNLRAALLRPALCLAAMAAAVLLLRLGWAAAGLDGRRLDAAAESLLGVLLGAAVFLAAALRLRLISGAELSALPRVGPQLVLVLDKLRLLPRQA